MQVVTSERCVDVEKGRHGEGVMGGAVEGVRTGSRRRSVSHCFDVDLETDRLGTRCAVMGARWQVGRVDSGSCEVVLVEGKFYYAEPQV